LGSLPLRLTEREACITDLESAPSAALPRSSLGLPHLNAEPAQCQCQGQMLQGKKYFLNDTVGYLQCIRRRPEGIISNRADLS
ncbi:hypothetical protein, partial [Candidatus Methylobacter favarea]|uniref:hypothetical protein n=1 Tax=Candidatus Methylobacter favarea TaxID=2707345 RepID=UPI001C2DE6D9